MKSTDRFKETIKDHLDRRAAEDPLFAEKYNNPDKKIDDCITYILNTVKNSGCHGYADEEIFGMAVHYYDEEKIDIGSPAVSGSVVVNHKIDLSEEEKQEAREKAMKKFEDIELIKLRQSQERKEAREKKKQEKLKKEEAERRASMLAKKKEIAMMQQSLF